MKKNFYFYTNLFAWSLVFLLIGNYVFGWTTPTGNPPSSNLSAPINVSSINQSKEGYLAIGTSTAPTIPLNVVGTANMTTLSIGGTSITATPAELNFVDGVTSAIQTQLGTKAPLASPTFTGSVTMPGTGIWNSSGFVGIGTTSPGAKLDVAPASDGDVGIIVGKSGVSGIINSPTNMYINVDSDNNAANDQIVFGTNRTAWTGGTEWMRIKDGNVGIGTTAPDTSLHVLLGSSVLSNPKTLSGMMLERDNSVGFNFITPNDKFAAIQFGDPEDSDIGKIAYNHADNSMRFTVNTGEKLTLLSNGNVGIGTTNPSAAKLQISTAADATGLLVYSAAGTLAERTYTTGNAGLILNSYQSIGNPTYIKTSDIVASADAGISSQMRFFTSNAGTIGEAMRIDKSGNVGIGTTAPGYKLDVASGGSTTARFGTASGDYVTIGSGAGKLYVGTIDPIYTINGKSYATYLSGMIGVKEETTGIIQIQNSKCKNQNSELICEYVIDFNSLKEGSDLWLFAQTTNLKKNFNKMVVLLTPAFDGKVWYDKDANENILTIFAIPNSESDSNLELSYRLTAPRFDYDQWSNYSDIDAEGFNLDKLLP